MGLAAQFKMDIMQVMTNHKHGRRVDKDMARQFKLDIMHVMTNHKHGRRVIPIEAIIQIARLIYKTMNREHYSDGCEPISRIGAKLLNTHYGIRCEAKIVLICKDDGTSFGHWVIVPTNGTISIR